MDCTMFCLKRGTGWSVLAYCHRHLSPHCLDLCVFRKDTLSIKNIHIYFQADASFCLHTHASSACMWTLPLNMKNTPLPPPSLPRGRGRPRRLSALPTAAHNGQHHKGSVIPSLQPDDAWQKSQLTGKSHLLCGGHLSTVRWEKLNGHSHK